MIEVTLVMHTGYKNHEGITVLNSKPIASTIHQAIL